MPKRPRSEDDDCHDVAMEMNAEASDRGSNSEWEEEVVWLRFPSTLNNQPLSSSTGDTIELDGLAEGLADPLARLSHGSTYIGRIVPLTTSPLVLELRTQEDGSTNMTEAPLRAPTIDPVVVTIEGGGETVVHASKEKVRYEMVQSWKPSRMVVFDRLLTVQREDVGDEGERVKS